MSATALGARPQVQDLELEFALELEQYLDDSQQGEPTNGQEAGSAPPTAASPGAEQPTAMSQNKRKEKARIAARARRSQEANIIMEMAQELRISQERLRRIDKATIVKLAIDYIKAAEVLRNIEPFAHKDREAQIIGDRAQLKEDEKEKLEDEQTQRAENWSDNQENQCQPELANLASGQDETSATRPAARQQAKSGQPLERAPPLFSAPKLATASIFAPKTRDNMNSHFLMIEEKHDGGSSFVLKPDTEILDEDDLTHLAPQAGDISISLDVEPLDGIPLDDLLVVPSSPMKITATPHQEGDSAPDGPGRPQILAQSIKSEIVGPSQGATAVVAGDSSPQRQSTGGASAPTAQANARPAVAPRPDPRAIQCQLTNPMTSRIDPRQLQVQLERDYQLQQQPQAISQPPLQQINMAQRRPVARLARHLHGGKLAVLQQHQSRSRFVREQQAHHWEDNSSGYYYAPQDLAHTNHDFYYDPRACADEADQLVGGHSSGSASPPMKKLHTAGPSDELEDDELAAEERRVFHRQLNWHKTVHMSHHLNRQQQQQRAKQTRAQMGHETRYGRFPEFHHTNYMSAID